MQDNRINPTKRWKIIMSIAALIAVSALGVDIYLVVSSDEPWDFFNTYIMAALFMSTAAIIAARVRK